MNERDRPNTTSTWPPPELTSEEGNDDKTVVVKMNLQLVRLLLESGSAAIDEPAPDGEERP
ncbi:hypothetical protein K8R04_04250 [Candidatus Uhrbacteria bacterium]|nr:hypothetical protein [Candidatus Uhrbacteria bacterium]